MARKSKVASMVAVAGAATVILSKRNLRTKISHSVQSMYNQMTGKKQLRKTEHTKYIGHSHPHAYEDNKMVGEGALTSVQYYNKRQQESHQ